MMFIRKLVQYPTSSALIKRVNRLYSPMQFANEEIWRRWNNKVLREKVSHFLGDVPVLMKDRPRAILSRGVLTPNFETRRFVDVAKLSGLDPVCAEFYDDKFTSQNKDKIHLAKLIFFHKLDKNLRPIFGKRTIIDFKINENKSFKNVSTIDGHSFIDFHHDLYKKEYKEILDCFDISIYKRNGENAKEVYEKIFSLCIANGILFENFIAKDKEREKTFTVDVVMPAFKAVTKRFGCRPIVVPLLPLEDEEKDIWMWYPGRLEKYYIH